MPATEAPRRQRQGKPKVKTGCATCKSRKVKCDERRPHCLRCVKFGRVCEGYEPGQLRPADAPLLAIRPRPIASLSIYKPSLAIFDEPDEQRYFHAYVETTATDISGPFQSDFWYRIVPQAAQSEATIRHAATAITALMKTTKRLSTSSLLLNSQCTQDPHLAFALRQYTKAIQSLQKEIKNAVSHRMLLISCLLFICIDVLQGDQVTALKQIYSGLNLLCQSRPWSHMLKPRFPKPWNPEPIEDELWQMLTNLNGHAYMLLGAQHPHHGPQYNEAKNVMIYPPVPRRFHSVNQAKISLDLVLSGIPMFLERHPDDPLANSGPAKGYNGQVEYEAQRQRLDCWEAAYEPFLEFFAARHNQIHYGESVLPIYHKLALITLEAGRNPEETNYDKFYKEFEYIVTHSRTIIDYRLKHPVNYLPRFSFDVGLLPSLHVTAAKCREPKIRREAIRLLNIYPQQEGLWSGYDSAKICEWMMGLEEAEADQNGFIPENGRVKLVDMGCDFEGKKKRVQCQKVVPNANGTFETRDWEYPV